MKKKFKIHIDKNHIKPIFTIEPLEVVKDLTTKTVKLDEEFELGTVKYTIIRIGNIFKIKTVSRNESFRIYNRITILLPLTLDNKKNSHGNDIIGIRPPTNRLEAILTNFKIGYKSIRFTNADMRIVDNYEFKFTDGELETTGPYLIFRNFNWIILANRSDNRIIFNKIIVREDIDMSPEALNELESKLAILRFYDHYSEIPVDEMKPVFEKMLTGYFKIPKDQLNNVLHYTADEVETDMMCITDDSLLTDGLVFSDPVFKCSDYRYIIKFATNNRTNLKHKLVSININPTKLNVGLMYIIQTILSNEPAVIIYDETKDRNYLL